MQEPTKEIVASAPTPRWVDAVVFLLLGVATVATFGRALENGFVWDTIAYFHLAPELTLSGEFAGWAFRTLALSNWHPLTWLSWAADATLHGGMAPGGFHLTNVILHWLVAFFVYRLFVTIEAATRAGGPRPLAFTVAAALAALLWCVHPQRVEVVAWVAQRKDLLCTLFLLITVIAYVRFRSGGSRAWYAGALAAYALAVLSKPMAVVLPPILLLLEFFPLCQRPGATARPGRMLAASAPFWLLAVGLAWVTMIAQQDTVAGNVGVELGTRIVHAFSQTVVYLQKALLPLQLSPYYPFPDPYPIGAQAIAAIVALTAITVLVTVHAWRRRVFGPAVAWFAFLVCLLPVIGLIKVGTQAGADRYTYVPLIPLHLAAALGVARIVDSRARAVGAVAGALALALLFGAMARDYTQVFRDRTTLWARAATTFPASRTAIMNSAAAYFDAGAWAEADARFEAARQMDGFRYEMGHLVHWAYVKIHLGQLDDALEIFQVAKALQLLPACTDYNIAWTLARLGRGEEAIPVLDALDARSGGAPSALSEALRRALVMPPGLGSLEAVPYCSDRHEVSVVTRRSLFE